MNFFTVNGHTFETDIAEEAVKELFRKSRASKRNVFEYHDIRLFSMPSVREYIIYVRAKWTVSIDSANSVRQDNVLDTLGPDASKYIFPSNINRWGIDLNEVVHNGRLPVTIDCIFHVFVTPGRRYKCKHCKKYKIREFMQDTKMERMSKGCKACFSERRSQYYQGRKLSNK